MDNGQAKTEAIFRSPIFFSFSVDGLSWESGTARSLDRRLATWANAPWMPGRGRGVVVAQLELTDTYILTSSAAAFH